jgi:NAD(P)-dependent dehydrogenase (short-subunit alcohol dehydrogenase family)
VISSPESGTTFIPDQTPTAVTGSKLKGRCALVTGGTRGIGAAIVRSLASQGASIAAGYGTGQHRAELFQKEFQTDFPDNHFSLHSGNIGNGDDCRRVVAETLEEHGRLDILVNNAGITIDKTVAKMTDDDWHKVIDVNLSGAFFLSQAALSHMIERGSGRIVMVSSVIGETGAIGQANYAASKSALFGLTKTLAKEAAFYLGRAGKLSETGVGVTVNAVTPGFIATEMIDAVPEKVLDRIRSTIPFARLGRAEEVARVVHFLAADASSYITGQIWAVNGGLDM